MTSLSLDPGVLEFWSLAKLENRGGWVGGGVGGGASRPSHMRSFDELYIVMEPEAQARFFGRFLQPCIRSQRQLLLQAL